MNEEISNFIENNEIKFVVDDLGMFKCELCNEVLKSPIRIKVCGCRYCKKCLEKELKLNSLFECPLNIGYCKTVTSISEDTVEDDDISNQIMNLTAKCPQCDEIMNIDGLYNHFKENHNESDDENDDFTEVKESVDDKLDIFEMKLNEMDQNIKQMDYNSYIWKIKNTFKENEILSESFYSSPNRYKIRLIAYPKGYGTGSENFFSVYFEIQDSDYDDLLAWPFHGEITMTILSRFLPNYSKSIKLKGPFFSRPLPTGKYKRKGISKFISHEQLRNYEYKDETNGDKFIYLTCSVVEN